jgi:hypothetical protein
MCFVSITKIVTKIQKSIAYWMSMILIFFCIIGKPIMLALHKWVPFLILYLKFLKYVRNIWKTINVIEILGHCSV